MQLDVFQQNLPANCLIFQLQDGLYTIGVDVPEPTPPKPPTHALPTSSYTALMRLSSLDDSIQDALSTREQLAAQINDILEHNKEASDVSRQALQGVEEAALTKRYAVGEGKQLKQVIKRRGQLQDSLAARREFMRRGIESQDRAQLDVDVAMEKLAHCRSTLTGAVENMRGQRRRICEELLKVFPIESTTQSLLFTICGLPLPNTSFDNSDADIIAAALGHVARVVDMLQYYLSVPLPYPVTAFGSRSIVRDLISMLPDAQRTFPLYTKGTVKFRFDYAVFLLNKDIECLAEAQGLKLVDIRQTLPNLKYLLYVCSAGNNELPARRAGGVRGLLSGRGTPVGSRRGSNASGQGDAVRAAVENGNADARHKAETAALILPFGIGKDRGSLRTSGLRENVVR